MTIRTVGVKHKRAQVHVWAIVVFKVEWKNKILQIVYKV